MKRKTFLLGTLLALTLAATGCAKGASDSASNDTAELKTVKIGSTAATAQLSENALLAQQLGYLDEELENAGYKAEYVGFAQAGPAVNEAFAAKEIDFAVYADFPAIAAKSNGIDIQVVALANQQMNYALLATQASGITSWKDLEGKKVIVPTGTILYKYYADECAKNGVDLSKIEQINSISDAQTLLASGDADALITAYSSALLFENIGLGTVVDNTTDELEEASGLVVAGRTQYVKENPDAVAALIRALNRSAEYIRENPDDAYEKMKTEAASVDNLKQTYEYDDSFSYFNPEITDEYLERTQRVYDYENENGILGSEFDLKDLFDPSYVKEALAQ